MTTMAGGWRHGGWAAALIVAALWAMPARAAGIAATVTDEHGKPLPGAVITLMPTGGTPAPNPTPALAAAEIDQKDEMFMPETVVVRQGGAVTFRNSDRTRHQVYSFSAIKQFEFVQKPNDVSAPVVFDKPGVAAIGCNIHDQMIAYVYVTKAPWAVVTDLNGRAEINGLPAGRFTAMVWHSRLRPGTPAPSQAVALATADTRIEVTIPVLPPRRSRSSDSLY